MPPRHNRPTIRQASGENSFTRSGSREIINATTCQIRTSVQSSINVAAWFKTRLQARAARCQFGSQICAIFCANRPGSLRCIAHIHTRCATQKSLLLNHANVAALSHTALLPVDDLYLHRQCVRDNAVPNVPEIRTFLLKNREACV